MNTPIINISDDENIITHESGVKTQFVEDYSVKCFLCVYRFIDENCVTVECQASYRKDKKNGHFE